jgi:murein L,D-transpeptidase YcbB/YkuD
VQLEKKELPDTIAKLKKSLKEGDSAAVVPAIKKRLNLLQDDVFASYNSVVDEALVNAAKKYQRTNGLADDGVIGNKMIAELNVPVKKRIQQILVNMERARWMPVERGKNFALVNIPEFKLHVFENGKQQFEMKVIVGSAAHNTVIFTAQLKYIVFSPYWNVPASITRNEIVPAIRRNSNYISKNNMEVTGYVNGLPEIRQKPGPHNALGLVKFLFPNSFNIYLHDTPGKHLFEQTGRGFSHGCIRIAEPKKFAEYLLRDDRQTYTSEAIDSLMNLGKEKWVPLKKPIPVFLVYFTAWVDAEGVLNFRNDFYGHDKKMAAKLFNN